MYVRMYVMKSLEVFVELGGEEKHVYDRLLKFFWSDLWK